MFSIVVPLFNKAHTIRRTISAALAQTHRDFEVIVVDDGSTDGSAGKVDEILDPRIRLIRQPNLGPGPARNTGIEAATFPWVAFLDGDDVWMPDHLAELHRIHRYYPEAGLIGTKYIASDEEGVFLLPKAREGKIELVDFFKATTEGLAPIWTSAAAISKTTFRDFGGFIDSPFGQDAEYWARIALKRPVATSSKLTAIYIRGTGGITETTGNRWLGWDRKSYETLSPTTSLLRRERYKIRCETTRRNIDHYIYSVAGWCIYESAVCGDIETLRAMRRLHFKRAHWDQKCILFSSHAPASIARLVIRCAWHTKKLVQKIRARASVTYSDLSTVRDACPGEQSRRDEKRSARDGPQKPLARSGLR